jgi:uncharacterized membrane protein
LGDQTIDKLILVLLVRVLELKAVSTLAYYSSIRLPSEQLIAFALPLRSGYPRFTAYCLAFGHVDAV